MDYFDRVVDTYAKFFGLNLSQEEIIQLTNYKEKKIEIEEDVMED